MAENGESGVKLTNQLLILEKYGGDYYGGNIKMGGICISFGGMGWSFPEIGVLPLFIPYMVQVRSVLASAGVSVSMLMSYNQDMMRFRVS